MDIEQNGVPLLTVEVTQPEASVVIVRLAGELDLSNIERLESDVAAALEPPPDRLVIEAAGLEFADSSAIALWLRWAASVEHFEIRDLSPLLRRVLTAMGLEQRLELRP